MARPVFVSYSLPDRQVAYELVTHLERHGLQSWIAPRDISPAADWAAEIIDAISAARLMVLVFSSHSNSSPQVRREVERAVHKQLPVLPFRLDDILPSKSLEYFLSAQHWLDAFPPPLEPHYAKLCSHIAALLATPEATPSAHKADVSAPAPMQMSFSSAQLEQVQRQLAYHIGPLAKHLVQRAARRNPHWDQLIAQLAGEIDSAAARGEFLAACRALNRPGP